MAIFKRGRNYSYSFFWNNQHIQRSTKQPNRQVALMLQAAHKTRLAKNELGIYERGPVPTLKQFSQRFLDNAGVGRKRAPRLSTLEFYAFRLNTILKFEPLASAPLDRIKPELVQRYINRRQAEVSPACINRDLATLRRCLRVALELEVIDKVPRITLLQGERERSFVLSAAQERLYLAAAPQPLKDVAVLMLDTGLRVGEAVSLEWSSIHTDPVNGSRFGYLQVRSGKSQNAKRNVPLTKRVNAMLENRRSETKMPWVFASEDSQGPLSRSTVSHQHTALRRLLDLPDDFVVHSFRHTALTRFGESGVDSFTIKKLAGHSSVMVSEKYVHPTPESLERAFERLEEYNARALREGPKLLETATVSATAGRGPFEGG
jgi:integrase